MKTLARNIALTALFATSTVSAAETNDTASVSSLPPQSVIVISKNLSRSLDELNRIALKHLRDTGKLSAGAKFETIAHILVDDPAGVCEFLYFQGFEKPFWRVKVTLEGKVISAEKKIASEPQTNPDKLRVR